jgi:hypothetical protein
MAKKFMYVCLGILALTAAFHLGARYGQAGYVDHSTTGIVAAEVRSDGDVYVLLDCGEVWEWNRGNQEWSQHVSAPIPVSEIKFWHQLGVIDTNNQLWEEVGGQWFNRGTPPIGASSTHPTTWGRIKAEFGE